MIAGDNTWIIPEASLYVFGILQSSMHMAWTRVVSGKIKSDFQYSASIVYNNFPWPESPTEKQKIAVNNAAQEILDARRKFPNSSLADLYDDNTMPPDLVKGHHHLNRAVEAAYGKSFRADAERVSFLFSLFQKYTSLLPTVSTKKARKVPV